jgi:hypothetical protein
MDGSLPATQPQNSSPAVVAAAQWAKRIACLSCAVLGLCVVFNLANRLWTELRELSHEWGSARDADPVGYIGISGEHPDHKPPECVREEEGKVLLWAGNGVKGQAQWFDATGNDVPTLIQFQYAFGRDKVKTIDYPIYQPADGQIAGRIYPERTVVGLEYDNEARAYPMTVLKKVEVVNDVFGGRPIAVTHCPLLGRTVVYERSLDGEPISFGNSGYCYQKAFVLYDRRTDSLWYPRPEGLTAISGPLAGRVLHELDRPAEVRWGSWRRRNPDTLVLVGADRSRGIPLPPPSEIAERPN